MFDRLTEKLAAAFKKLKGHGKLTEGQVGEGPYFKVPLF